MRSLGDSVDALSNVLYIFSVDTSNGDTAVVGHVDMMVGSDLEHLGFRHAGVGEHPALVGDVFPVQSRA